MHCKLSVAAAFTACVAGLVSADTEFALFAYGKIARAGLRLCYADGKWEGTKQQTVLPPTYNFAGLAYIGGFPSFAKEAVNITREFSPVTRT